MAIDQETDNAGADEESQEVELDSVDSEASLENDDATVSDDSGADEESRDELDTDDSLTEDDQIEQEAPAIDYAAQIEELKRKYEEEHKARSGWDNKYRELHQEHSSLKSQYEQMIAKQKEAEEQRALPVWDRRSPKHQEFLSKIPQIELMDRLARELGQDPDVRGRLADIAGQVVSQDDLIAYQQFEKQKREISARIASGDYSPILDDVRATVEQTLAQKNEQAALMNRTKSILDNPENSRLYQEQQAKIESLISGGIDIETAFDVVRKEQSLSKAERALAELQAKQAEVEAKQKLLKTKAEPPSGGSQAPSTIDQDAVWKAASEAAMKQSGGRASPEKVMALFIDMMDERLANNR